MGHVNRCVILAAMFAGLVASCTYYDDTRYPRRTYAYTTDEYYYSRPVYYAPPVRYETVRVYSPSADAYFNEFGRDTP